MGLLQLVWKFCELMAVLGAASQTYPTQEALSGLLTRSQDWLLAGVSSLVLTTTATHSPLAPGQDLTLSHQGGGNTQPGHLRQERDEIFLIEE